MTTLGTIWKARKAIVEGVYNTVFKKKFIEDVAAYRMDICNKCDWKGDDCLVPGTGPCCGACGCSLEFKVRSLSSPCGLVQKGKEPKWFPVLSQKEEDELKGDVEEE